MIGQATGSSDEELALKFLFANLEGVHAVLRFSKSTLVADVKAQLMQNWPSGVAPADNAKCIRLICMGRGMLQDTQTLAAAKVPGFPTHPTPVNVSILRPTPAPASASSAKTPCSRGETATRPQQPQTAAVAPVPTPGCGCVII